MRTGKKIIFSVICILILIVGIIVGGGFTFFKLKNNIGLKEAYQIVLTDADVSREKSQLTDVDIEFENGKFIYEISFVSDTNEYEYEVDIKTGDILKRKSNTSTPAPSEIQATEPVSETIYINTTNPDENNSVSESEISSSGNLIGIDEAKRIALNKAGCNFDSVRFTGADIEKKHGRKIYEIKFIFDIYEYEVEINALSGEIVSFEREIDD